MDEKSPDRSSAAEAQRIHTQADAQRAHEDVHGSEDADVLTSSKYRYNAHHTLQPYLQGIPRWGQQDAGRVG